MSALCIPDTLEKFFLSLDSAIGRCGEKFKEISLCKTQRPLHARAKTRNVRSRPPVQMDRFDFRWPRNSHERASRLGRRDRGIECQRGRVGYSRWSVPSCDVMRNIAREGTGAGINSIAYLPFIPRQFEKYCGEKVGDDPRRAMPL